VPARRGNGRDGVAIIAVVTATLPREAHRANAPQLAMLSAIERELRKVNLVKISRMTPRNKRADRLHRFVTDPTCRLFLGDICTMGADVSPTAAGTVLMVDAEWSAAANAQAIMRIHKVGQTKPVKVKFLSSDDPVDRRLQAALVKGARAITRVATQAAEMR
jgi:SWI/SNF-related matrix-associated actin-dependent regulator 1 of chromatin subfamily A